MKYIKKFEDDEYDNIIFNINKYWLIPTDSIRYKEALDTLHCDKDSLYGLKITHIYDYVYVGFSKKYDWSYSSPISDSYEKNGFEYCGGVNLTDDEIMNHDLSIAQKKYNI